MSDHRLPMLIYKVDNLVMQRDTASASTLMTGSEQTLFEKSSTTYVFQFGGGWIDLTNMTTGDAVTVKTYVKIKSGGTYLLTSNETYYDGQAIPAIAIGNLSNYYGVKITVQQTAGTYRTFDHEWYVAERGS